MVLKGADWDFRLAFEERHQREFGFLFQEKPILVDDFRVRAIGAAHEKIAASPFAQLNQAASLDVPQASPNATNRVYYEGTGYLETPTYELPTIAVGSKISGPALIIDKTQTIVVLPNAVANSRWAELCRRHLCLPTSRRDLTSRALSSRTTAAWSRTHPTSPYILEVCNSL
ncbi:hydantoinase B oxoprolinase [Olea europaea subsp. europaea]|uniref:Hydantoinase B oxoprolinase n=1 Tax=Olea europaea subsp. europaea TaxID=158383 RepID=A0A8S0STA6_OLEEU|nr:hydantoinase B oxoprolinase [Olea europaea subsp. europaea]